MRVRPSKRDNRLLLTRAEANRKCAKRGHDDDDEKLRQPRESTL